MAPRRSLYRRPGRPIRPGSLLLLLLLWLLLMHPRLLILIASAVAVAFLVRWTAKAMQQRHARQALRQLDLHQVDAMDPRRFEGFVAELMAAQGYRTQLTKASHDFGVDVVASHGSRCIGVQVKHYRSPVSGSAVAQALLGMPHYRCNECMVVTNSTFTRAAVKAAAPHPCTLIDRQELALWLREIKSRAQ